MLINIIKAIALEPFCQTRLRRMCSRQTTPTPATAMMLKPGIATRAQCAQLLFALCLVCVGLLYIVDTIPNFYEQRPTALDWQLVRQQQDAARNPAYFVHDTAAGGGCRMPSFPAFSETARRFYAHQPPPFPVGCPAALTQSDADGRVWVALNRSALRREYGIAEAEGLSCAVVPLKRLTDTRSELRGKERWLRLGQVVRVVGANFVRVRCQFETSFDGVAKETVKKRKQVDEYHFFVRPEWVEAADGVCIDAVYII